MRQMAPSSVKSFLPLLVILVTSPRVSGQTGSFKYCCSIQKCKNVTAVCRTDPACSEECLYGPNTTFPATCQPAASLQYQSYECFAKYMDSTSSLIGQVCGQTYDPKLPPAPPALITFGTCMVDCSGWDLASSTSLQGSVALLMQYILPVVVFCTTIPRRRRWEVPHWFFELGSSKHGELDRLPGGISMSLLSLDRNFLKPFQLVLCLLISGIIITADMTVWVFTVFIAAGAILVGGIIESAIDFEITRHLEDSCVGGSVSTLESSNCLSANERVELIIALLCGNLDLDVDQDARRPENVIRNALLLPDLTTYKAEYFSPRLHSLRQKLDTTKKHLKCILRSQGTFGSFVGAPVLFFIGAFAVTLDSLSNNIGDNETAHSLAYGMWWTVIVLVSVVSGCILASNNPNTITSIVASSSSNWEQVPVQHGQNAFLGMTPVYESQFTPVTLWNRGRMKKRWLEGTSAWRNRRFRRLVALRPLMGWVPIPAFAFVLVLIPTSLAFVISYTTPKICVGCRALVFAVYTGCQLVLIIANTWWTYNSDLQFPSMTLLRWPATQSQAIPCLLSKSSLYLLSLTPVVFAFVGSLFASFAGTVLELLGTFSNCICSIPATKWLSPDRDLETFNLATDTEEHRRMSSYWSACGYATIAFMAVVTYGGWWYQRVLRRKLVVEIDRLG